MVSGRRYLDRIVAGLLFIGMFGVTVATITDYGLTWDEKYYIENARSIESWFSRACTSTEAFSQNEIASSWHSELEENLSGNVHPPFYKLSAIVFRHLLGKSLFDNPVFQYRVSTAFWAAVLVVAIFWTVRRFTDSTGWGLFGGLIFAAVPRFFADAHFFATDMVVASLGFSGLVVATGAARPWQRVVLGGALLGAALATKFTGLLALFILLSMVVIADNRMQFLREYLLLALSSLVCFSLFNFPVLFDPSRELAFYFSSVLQRSKLIPIEVIYFGRYYEFSPPWHQPWVTMGITLPSLVVVTAVVGMVGSAIRFARYRDRLSYFALVPFLILMGIYMAPATPKHDGIRLFSSAWPFVVLLSVVGCLVIHDLVKERWRTGTVIAAATFLSCLVAISEYHPYELSYYNWFIGGAKGAEEKGFSISYWYEAFNQDFFRQVEQKISSTPGTYFSFPSLDIVEWNRKYGLFKADLKATAMDGEYQYILFLNRIRSPEMAEFLSRCQKLVEITTRDGASIGGLYRNVTTVRKP